VVAVKTKAAALTPRPPKGGAVVAATSSAKNTRKRSTRARSAEAYGAGESGGDAGTSSDRAQRARDALGPERLVHSDLVVALHDALDAALDGHEARHGHPASETLRRDAVEVVHTVGRALLSDDAEIVELVARTIRDSRVRDWLGVCRRRWTVEPPSNAAALALIIDLAQVMPAPRRLRAANVLRAWERGSPKQMAAQLAVDSGAFGQTYREAYARVRNLETPDELRARRKPAG
jgi:hypothetical protein